MLYSICIGLILVASILLILAVLVQSPKSGMAANFGAANQVMGVRDSANALEKITWWLALSLVATVSMENEVTSGANALQQDADALLEKVATEEVAMPQAEIPAEGEAVEAEAPAAE